MDDGLFISQSNSIDISNSHLYCSYNVLTNLLEKFGLVVEHSKTEIFHFNRSHGVFNPPPLDLSPLGENVLLPSNTWKYLEFIFDRKLTFHQHVDFYANKAISVVKCMKLLDNSSYSINPLQKHLLYRLCILPIALYGFQLWFYNHAPTAYHMKTLNKMQRCTAIWILGIFKTSPSHDVEAIAGLILIKLHLQKLGGRSQLQVYKLPHNYLLCSLIESNLNLSSNFKSTALDLLTNRQHSLVKSHLIDMANRSHKCFLSFSPLNSEFSPGLRIIDIFSDHFSFNICDKRKYIKFQAQELDELTLESSSSPSVALIALDASIKNNVATSIAHIYMVNKPLTKTIHHAVNVTSTEAELFAIRCGINQSIRFDNISKIVVITDSIHIAQKIFDSSSHPFQTMLATILSDLCNFFNRHDNNSIEFWECPSCLKWHLHGEVDKETKSFNLTPLFPCKNSWDFSKKNKSDNIIKAWKMMFQASDLKGNHFLDLLDDDNKIIKPTYAKGRSCLKLIGHSNSLCAHAMRAITNHAPISEYRLRFFPRKEFRCPCGRYPIKSRQHILHECVRFNGYWNPRRDSYSYFVMFLVFSPNSFSFCDLLG